MRVETPGYFWSNKGIQNEIQTTNLKWKIFLGMSEVLVFWFRHFYLPC